ncbi:S8 family serine peptidase [Aureispira anguillae]|uniref:S8 family serine peptidase n=1 Tax=Aureispira anguillae TaxID=2864201 RepID=A0A915YKE0_9BACT|nr:S8 family serine peptidase [Aureispira anguillae]BDS14572.1 S8 family serine peptidase [Aureispira anguillae]
MRAILTTIIIGFLLGTTIFAQEQNYLSNQFLIQLNSDYEIKQLMARLEDYAPSSKWEAPQQLIPKMNIWLLKYQGGSPQEKLLNFFNQSSMVDIAQYNHKITLRSPAPPPAPTATTPNDPYFNNQWQYINTGASGGTAGVDLDADLAWDITTGGLTANNDTIVVAILDDGISHSQTDFGDNLWVNRAEIPNNGIDDDNNGYQDDYLGWNSLSNNDLISGGGHGTSVAGIIGAQGDNGIGVTGVNWNVKMMIIKNDFNTSEANVLIAYGYALTQRKIYNQTNGQQGAYVVATNASWGLNNGQPANAPLWCSFYDTLGSYGILNIAATANSNVNVDAVGDLPTACPSDYLVAVTNVNKLGNKELGAAYGSTSIDLGAFGSGVYTTKAPSSFGIFGGTSAASPHVAGAVALLYSGACSNFMAYSLVHPDSAALKMKSYLMNGVVGISDLNGTTVSGGYLNLFNSLGLCLNDCPSNACFAPYQVSTSNHIDTQVQINWVFPPTVNQAQYRYREQGGTWSSLVTIPIGQNNVVLNNLLACTNYEIQLNSLCGATVGNSTLYNFKTDGCCEAPTALNYTVVSSDSVLLNWNNLLAGNTYILSYLEMGTNNWQQISNISNNSYWLTNLNACSYYSATLQAICNNGDTTSYSDTINFVTQGCLSCSTINYCSANGSNTTHDWIDTFSVDNFKHASGNNNGYFFYSNVDIFLGKGDYHNISISQGKSFTEHVKIWLDINQDGDFMDANEEVYSTVMPVNTKTVQGSIIVPATSTLGITRMRVGLRWNNPPPNCGVTDAGEIEDYCVQIIPGTSTTTLPNHLSSIYVYPNPFSDNITMDMALAKPTNLTVAIYSATGQLMHHQTLLNQTTGSQSIHLKPQIPAGVYFLQISSPEGQVTKRIIKL